jgi:hypothetical protein
MSVITRLAPPSLQGYQRSWLPRDIVAGVTLAAVVIPETMARSLQRAAAPRMGSGRFPCRREDVRSGLVYARSGVVDSERPKPEVARLTVEQ